jgi:hypothetical protein
MNIITYACYVTLIVKLNKVKLINLEIFEINFYIGVFFAINGKLNIYRIIFFGSRLIYLNLY